MPVLIFEQAPFRLFKYKDVRFDWGAHRAAIDSLDGFDAELAQEAIYRANGNLSMAREYCKAHQSGLAGPRNPIPLEEADTSALSETGGPANDGETVSATNTTEADRMSLDAPPELAPPDLADRFLGDALGDIMDAAPQSTDEARETPRSQPAATAPTATSTPDEPADRRVETPAVPGKEDLDKCRGKLRENLIDRCLDVIRAHPGSAIEVSELIQVMVLRQQNSDAQEEVGSTLTFALSSLALDDEDKKLNGKCIAAYAHLLALLLQDESFFENNIESLRDKVEEYVGFLNAPPSTSTEEMPPWIPYILLVVEGLLCYDEKPVAAQWKAPTSLEDAVDAPVIQLRDPLVDEGNRAAILESLLELLPRIGKEETLAVSALRVMVILTRHRRLAKHVGEKKNLQRLFLMAKQLSGSGSERLKQAKLTGLIITILRHVVEDEDTIKIVMRSEIRAGYPTLQRSQRGSADVASYLRSLAHIALRAPDLFVEVTNEMFRFARWTPPSEGARTQPLVYKDQPTEPNNDKSDTPKQTSEDSSASTDIKQSTEPTDKEMSDVPRSHPESKRPVVEHPDGVIHFLLCELVNYREVDDKETSVLGKDPKTDGDTPAEGQSSTPKDSTATDGKDKKPPKPVFKAEEHPIFIYRCFLLNCLAELLQSYNRTKVEFINFKRSAPPLTMNTPVKPRSSVLNYLIYDLLCQGNLSGTTDTIAAKKKAATSTQTEKVLVALVSKTFEKPVDRSKSKFYYDDEPDLLFVRRFVLDTMLKAYERAPVSDEPLEVRYSRMQCLAELMNNMVGEKEKDHQPATRGADGAPVRSQAQLRRLMYEKGYLDKLTSSIAEINLNYPGVKRAIKYILRVLRVLTDTAKELSHANILPSESLSDHPDDEIGSTSSLSDLDDDREETPDLYRNSALGMLEPRGDSDESDEDEEDEDEDMYGDEYDDEEMDYDNDDISDVQDNISDEDEELSEMGEIEGLHGEPGVVEVIMDGDDDEDDDSEEDSEDDDDDDEVESADMEDIEDQVEIVDEDGNPIDDDGNSGWESESQDEDGEPEEERYIAELRPDEEAHLHGMGPGALIDGMARAIMGGDGYDRDLIMDGLDDPYLDDDHDEDGKSEAVTVCTRANFDQKMTKMRMRWTMRSTSTMNIPVSYP